MKFFHLYDTTKERDFVSRGKLYVTAGALFGTAMLAATLLGGINWGIDFVGGMEMQVKFGRAVKAEEIRRAVADMGYAKHQVQQFGQEADNEWLVRVERVSTLTPELLQTAEAAVEKALGQEVSLEFHASEGDRFALFVPFTAEGEGLDLASKLDGVQATLAQAIDGVPGLRLRRTRAAGGEETTLDALVRDEPYQGRVRFLVQLQGISDKVSKELGARFGDVEVRRVDFVDATVAQELKTSGLVALILSLALILVYVAIRFDLFFAPGAVIALLHDPLGALAVFVIGRMEFDLPSVAALLTVVGYSIGHTIVIYDRVRETTPPEPPGGYDHATIRTIVNKAVSETLNRTINSTTTSLFTTIAMWIFAEGSVRTFAACLSVGVFIGALSSLFMAPTIYLWFHKTFYTPPDPNVRRGLTREDRERGVV